MAELLQDNLEAQRRAGAASSSTPPTPMSRREVLSWVQCFGTYMAVVTSKFPHRIKELLAYQTLIVREARRCGGKGWLAYDAHFCQQVVGNESADWSRLNQSLYAVTFVTQGERERRRSCVLCLESDHAEEQCALYTPPPKSVGSSKKFVGDHVPSESRDAVVTPRGKGSSRMACFARTQGECRFPACKYRHVCVRCSGDHRAIRCPWLRSDRDNSRPRDSKGDAEKHQ